MKRILSALLCIVLIISLFSSCSNNGGITDAVQTDKTVLINGERVDTVEASMGAFQGKQGSYIEFQFSEPQIIDTYFIIEKTTSVRQFNIYAEVDGKFKCVYTGKNILNEEIKTEPETATAVKLEILNTQIGNDSFTITSVSAYNSQEAAK